MVSIDEDIRVLHTEDEPELAELAATFIEREDERFVVESAGDASAGLDRLADGEFDCVVSDYDMPGRNGIEFLRAVRDRYPELPFILYTGKGSEEVASEAISAGVTDYLQKEAGTDQYTLLANRMLNAVVKRRARQQATEVEQQLQDLSEISNDVLWMFTHDWNELLYTPDSAERLLSGAYSRSLEGRLGREKRELVAADGTVVEALLRAVPRRTAAGEVIGTVAMYLDITERESVRRANERLEEFTSIVSHDLRNPLNVATGRLELVADECDSEHLDRLERALDRMAALIDDLLTLSREGRGVTDPQPVDLATIINGCWENVETWKAVLTTTTDRNVRADRSRLKQVFENLFRNAVEHGGARFEITDVEFVAP